MKRGQRREQRPRWECRHGTRHGAGRQQIPGSRENGARNPRFMGIRARVEPIRHDRLRAKQIDGYADFEETQVWARSRFFLGAAPRHTGGNPWAIFPWDRSFADLSR